MAKVAVYRARKVFFAIMLSFASFVLIAQIARSFLL
jgi:hypothetical protein